MPTNSWIAEEAGQASDPTKWSLGRIPQDGDDIDIGTASDNNCAWDIDGLELAGFDMSNLASGSSVALSYGFGCTSINGNSFAPINGASAGKVITCSGNAIVPYSNSNWPSIRMTGEGSTIKCMGANAWTKLWVDANVSTSGNLSFYFFETASSKDLSIGSGHAASIYLFSGTWTNNGSVSGEGKAVLYARYATTIDLDLGDCSADVEIRGYGSATTNNSVTLAADAHFGGDLLVVSDSAYNVTLYTSSYALSCNDLTIGTMGILDADNSSITITGSFDYHSGTFLKDASSVYMTGDGTISGPNSSTAFYNLYVGYPGKTTNITTLSGVTFWGRVELMGGTVNASKNFYVLQSARAAGSGIWNQNGNLFLLLASSGGSTVYWPPFDIAGTGSLRLGSDGTGDNVLNMTGTPGNYTCSIVSSNAVAPYTTTVNMGASVVSAKSLSINSTNGNVIVNFQSSVVTLTNGMAIGGSKNTADLGSATLNASVSIAGGLLTGAGTINGNVTVSAGTLNNTGDIEITGLLTISGGALTGDGVHKFKLWEGINHTSGTITQYVNLLEFMASASYNSVAGVFYRLFQVDAGCTVVCNRNFGIYGSNDARLEVQAGAVLDLGMYSLNDYWFQNAVIAGRVLAYQYSINMVYSTSNPNITGSIEVTTLRFSSDSGSRTFNFAYDLDVDGDVEFYVGGGVSNTINLNGHTLSGDSITIKEGGVTVNANGTIIYRQDFDTSIGTFNHGNGTVIKEGSGTEKLGAGQAFYDYTAEVEPLNLASDVTIANDYIHARAAVLNGFTLTLTDPTREVRLFCKKSNLAGQAVTSVSLRGQYDDRD